jgi:hypothetical protein
MESAVLLSLADGRPQFIGSTGSHVLSRPIDLGREGNRHRTHCFELETNPLDRDQSAEPLGVTFELLPQRVNMNIKRMPTDGKSRSPHAID